MKNRRGTDKKNYTATIGAGTESWFFNIWRDGNLANNLRVVFI